MNGEGDKGRKGVRDTGTIILMKSITLITQIQRTR